MPLYAIGVFTAFSMAGFGMAKYHHTRREPGWRPKFIINFSAGALSLIVVVIFAVVKFTEGAWVVLVLFAIFVPALIRLNAEYRAEAEVLETVTGEQPPPAPHYSRRVVFVFVDSFDLATLAALRYARSLRPTQIRAVHFVIDSVRAEKLREKWTRADRGVALDFIDCPDRRLIKAATDLAEREIEDPGHPRHRDPAPAQLLAAARPPAARPHRGQDRRRGQPHPALGRHDRALRRAQPGRGAAGAGRRPPRRASGQRGRRGQQPPSPPRPQPAAQPGTRPGPGGGRGGAGAASPTSWPRTACPGSPATARAPGVAAIGTVTGGKVTVEGKVRVVEIRPVERNSVLAVEINDSTGNLTAMFYGRSHIPGLICGAPRPVQRLRAHPRRPAGDDQPRLRAGLARRGVAASGATRPVGSSS